MIEVKNKRFSVLGLYQHYTQTQIKDAIRALGGRIDHTPTPKTNYIVYGPSRDPEDGLPYIKTDKGEVIEFNELIKIIERVLKCKE